VTPALNYPCTGRYTVQGGVDSIWDWLGRATRGGDPCTKRHGADSFKGTQ
jgi:hypothetical protein